MFACNLVFTAVKGYIFLFKKEPPGEKVKSVKKPGKFEREKEQSAQKPKK